MACFSDAPLERSNSRYNCGAVKVNGRRSSLSTDSVVVPNDFANIIRESASTKS